MKKRKFEDCTLWNLKTCPGDDNCIYTRVKINARTHKIARVLLCTDQRKNHYKTTRVKNIPTFAKSQFVEEMHQMHACQALHSSTHAYMS